MTALDELENQSISIIRKAYSELRHLGLLWSMGKDSTVLLHLAKKAFLGCLPIPLIHVDTSFKIPEMIEWRDRIVRQNGYRLLIGQNTEALKNGMSSERGRLVCCRSLKTQSLLDVIERQNLDGLLVGIRRDEEGSRGKERIVSPRDSQGQWLYANQPAEVWDYLNFDVAEASHYRVHPLLNWTELDIWNYIRRENIEVMPLYFAKDGKRYRSLGCAPCTESISSSAGDIDEIIGELEKSVVGERAGRAQDKVEFHAMQALRKDGYM